MNLANAILTVNEFIGADHFVAEAMELCRSLLGWFINISQTRVSTFKAMM